MAPRSEIEAKVRIHPNPVAPPGFVPDQGSSLSAPIRPQRSIDKTKPVKTDGSIK